jgi:hypothetical protein
MTPRCVRDWVSLSLLVTLACGPLDPADGEHGEPLETIEASTHAIINGTPTTSDNTHLHVQVLNPDGIEAGRCSAELVRNTWAITTKHCFTVAGQTAVLRGNGVKGYSKQIVANERRDLALIELTEAVPIDGSTNGYRQHFYPWSAEWLKGEPVVVYGYGRDYALERANLVVNSAAPHQLAFNRNDSGQTTEDGDSGGGSYLTNITWEGRPVLASLTAFGPDDFSWSGQAVVGIELAWVYQTLFPNQNLVCDGPACATTVPALPDNLVTPPVNFQPCSEAWEYQASYALEQDFDYLKLDGVSHTGTGAIRGVKAAGSSLQIQLTTDGSVASSGLTMLKARCMQRQAISSDRTAVRAADPMVMVTRYPNPNTGVVFGQRKNATSVGAANWAWSSVGGYSSSQPVIGAHLDGRAVIIVRRSDGYLYYRNETSAGSKVFNQWAKLTGTSNTVVDFRGEPAIVRDGSGRLLLYVTDIYGSIYRIDQQSPNGPWGAWSPIGRIVVPWTDAGTQWKVTSSPVVVPNAEGGFALFVRGEDRGLWAMRLNESGYPLFNYEAWSSWVNLPYAELPDADVIAAAQNADGTVTVVAANTWNSVSYWTQASPSTNDWTVRGSLDGVSVGASRPAIAPNQDGRLTVVTLAADGKLQAISQSQPNDPWWDTPWITLGTSVGSSPVLERDATGILHAFALDSSSKLREVLQTTPNGSTWTSWSSGVLGGPLGGL